MRLRERVLTRLVPLLVPACMVDTPIAEGEANEDRLGAGLAAWCESMCGAECGPDDFDDSCPDLCVSIFAGTFADKTDICTGAGLSLMDCIEQNPCERLQDAGTCSWSQEIDRCLVSRGLTTCRSRESNTGGTAGFGGSSAPPPLESCSVRLDDCSDDREYGVECNATDSGFVCQCFVETSSTGRFAPSTRACPDDKALLSQICGWPVVDMVHEELMPPLVQCSIAASERTRGANEAECSLSFPDCSDGRSYAVDCSGSPGAVACTCSVDGEAVGVNESAAGVCPFSGEDDRGIVALNYACGFRIAPPLEF